MTLKYVIFSEKNQKCYKKAFYQKNGQILTQWRKYETATRNTTGHSIFLIKYLRMNQTTHARIRSRT